MARWAVAALLGFESVGPWLYIKPLDVFAFVLQAASNAPEHSARVSSSPCKWRRSTAVQQDVAGLKLTAQSEWRQSNRSGHVSCALPKQWLAVIVSVNFMKKIYMQCVATASNQNSRAPCVACQVSPWVGCHASHEARLSRLHGAVFRRNAVKHIETQLRVWALLFVDIVY